MSLDAGKDLQMGEGEQQDPAMYFLAGNPVWKGVQLRNLKNAEHYSVCFIPETVQDIFEKTYGHYPTFSLWHPCKQPGNHYFIRLLLLNFMTIEHFFRDSFFFMPIFTFSQLLLPFSL